MDSRKEFHANDHPDKKNKFSGQDASLILGGAGGSLQGETAAPPRSIRERLPSGQRLPDELIDELLASAQTEEEIVGPGGLLAGLTKRLVERAMEVELTDHLGYEHGDPPPGGAGNTRNGSTPKTLTTEHGPVRVETLRDRNGSFELRIVRKRQHRFEGFDEKVIAPYSRGLSTRDIQAYLGELYGVEVGRDLISRVTDAVMEDARAWASRPLDDIYPIVFLDCLVLGPPRHPGQLDMEYAWMHPDDLFQAANTRPRKAVNQSVCLQQEVE